MTQLNEAIKALNAAEAILRELIIMHDPQHPEHDAFMESEYESAVASERHAPSLDQMRNDRLAEAQKLIDALHG